MSAAAEPATAEAVVPTAPGVRRPRFHQDALLYLAVFALSFGSSALVSKLISEYVPKTHDEFAYLLQGQTFAQFRLTNPTHPMWRFFETQHILMHPSYMAKYPPGHGLVLAVGYWMGSPILGVWLESAGLAVATAWMLRAFFCWRWSLLGSILVILQFGLCHYWAQSFWGGALAAAGGALLLGATKRICDGGRTRDAILLGFGAIIIVLTRPFEGILVGVVPAALIVCTVWRGWRTDRAATLRRLVVPLFLMLVAGAAFLGYYNDRVTGSPVRLPYTEYESQYSGMPLFGWQNERPVPVFLNSPLEEYYRSYVVPLSQWRRPLPIVFWHRLVEVAAEYWGPVLTSLALAGFLCSRDRWRSIALASLGAALLATILCYWFSWSHYQAPAVAFYMFLAVSGLQAAHTRLAAVPGQRIGLFAMLFLAHLAVIVHAQNGEHGLPLHQGSSVRQNIIGAARFVGGRKLVFVRRIPPYNVHVSYVFNDAQIDASQVVWAWDRGPEENRRLLAYYPDRLPVLLTERDHHVELGPYAP